jgi:hypothetical protein
VSCSTKSPALFRPLFGQCPRRKQRHCNRRGQSLVEFAIVSLVVYMLLAAILTFGQILYSAQTLQQAADVAARELSRTPLPATADLMDVLYNNTGYDNVRNSVFDQAKLQVDLTTEVPSGQSVLDYVKTWPIINQMLYPLMIVVQPAAGGDEYLVYPGMVSCTDSAGRTVPCIAQVESRTSDGAETITWVPVIEEVTPGAFSVASGQRGLVALRINYPYQSASMSSFQPPANPASPPGPPDNPVVPIEANDANVTVNSNGYTATGEPLQSATNGIYNGAYGLGQQKAWAKDVRPYRSLISAQAIYRREVFQ